MRRALLAALAAALALPAAAYLPPSSAIIQKSPNETSLPRHATPRFLPFCCFLNLVRFGDNMGPSDGYWRMRRALRCSTSPLKIQTLTPMTPYVVRASARPKSTSARCVW